MPVLVTGAAGLIGSHVVEVLRERGIPVRALVRPGEPIEVLVRAGAEVRRGDLGDVASLEAAVQGVDRVLNCAGRKGPWGPRDEYERANVRGLEALLDASMASGVRRFVHVSSAIVHGTDVGGEADETAPLRLEPNPYSWSKILGEQRLQRAVSERDAPVTVVRPGLVYGPRDAGSFGRIAAMIEQGRMIVIGSGENHISLVYVRDVAEGIVLASEAPRAVGRAYLLVNDEPVTQRAYLDALAAELGVRPPRTRVPYLAARTLAALVETAVKAAGRAGPPPLTRFGVQVLGGECRFSIARAREEIGYAPRVSMAEGVRRAVAWYREQRRGTRGTSEVRRQRSAGGRS